MATYNLTKALLIERLEKEGNLVYSRAWDAMDVWLVWLIFALKLVVEYSDKLWLSKTGD